MRLLPFRNCLSMPIGLSREVVGGDRRQQHQVALHVELQLVEQAPDGLVLTDA